MEYTLGTTKSKDFYEFLINGTPPTEEQKQTQNKRKQPKLSSVKSKGMRSHKNLGAATMQQEYLVGATQAQNQNYYANGMSRLPSGSII